MDEYLAYTFGYNTFLSLSCRYCIYFFQAVKKSRVKSRMRTQETMQRVQKLKTENDMLEEKIKILSKELGFLKDLFLAHAGALKHSFLFIEKPCLF